MYPSCALAVSLHRGRVAALVVEFAGIIALRLIDGARQGSQPKQEIFPAVDLHVRTDPRDRDDRDAPK